MFNFLRLQILISVIQGFVIIISPTVLIEAAPASDPIASSSNLSRWGAPCTIGRCGRSGICVATDTPPGVYVPPNPGSGKGGTCRPIVAEGKPCGGRKLGKPAAVCNKYQTCLAASGESIAIEGGVCRHIVGKGKACGGSVAVGVKFPHLCKKGLVCQITTPGRTGRCVEELGSTISWQYSTHSKITSAITTTTSKTTFASTTTESSATTLHAQSVVSIPTRSVVIGSSSSPLLTATSTQDPPSSTTSAQVAATSTCSSSANFAYDMFPDSNLNAVTAGYKLNVGSLCECAAFVSSQPGTNFIMYSPNQQFCSYKSLTIDGSTTSWYLYNTSPYNGAILGGILISNMTAPSASDCLSLCNNSGGCLFINYKESGHICELNQLKSMSGVQLGFPTN